MEVFSKGFKSSFFRIYKSPALVLPFMISAFFAIIWIPLFLWWSGAFSSVSVVLDVYGDYLEARESELEEAQVPFAVYMKTHAPQDFGCRTVMIPGGERGLDCSEEILSFMNTNVALKFLICFIIWIFLAGFFGNWGMYTNGRACRDENKKYSFKDVLKLFMPSFSSYLQYIFVKFSFFILGVSIPLLMIFLGGLLLVYNLVLGLLAIIFAFFLSFVWFIFITYRLYFAETQLFLEDERSLWKILKGSFHFQKKGKWILILLIFIILGIQIFSDSVLKGPLVQFLSILFFSDQGAVHYFFNFSF